MPGSMMLHPCNTIVNGGANVKPCKQFRQSGHLLVHPFPTSNRCPRPPSTTAIKPVHSIASPAAKHRTAFISCKAAAAGAVQGPDGDAAKPDTISADTESPSLVARVLAVIGEVLWRTWQLGVLAVYTGFWLGLINILWFATGYSNIVWLVPVLWLFISDWALLKILTVIWVADTLSAWPFVVMKLLFDFIHHIHSARLESFPRSMRVLAAMLGRDLRAPVMANLRILHYSPREAGVLGPLTEPLADSSDTSVFKWNSLFDVAWGVVILWFLYCHFMMYEQWWGSWFPFGKGFNLAEILGTWHMPSLPANWRPDVSGAPVQFISKSVLPWGPYM